jgi:hypothetical protein
MLINYTLLFTVALILTLGICFLILRPFIKRKKYVAGGFTVFFTGMILFTGIIMMNSRVYVVTGNKACTRYAMYGTAEYKMQDGTSLKLEMPFQKCMIVNDCPEEVVVEKVIYGYNGNSKDKIVKPYRALITKAMAMDYLFDQRPPTSITSKSSGAEVRYWLRMRSDYESEYGKMLDEDKVEKLKELLKKKKEKSE